MKKKENKCARAWKNAACKRSKKKEAGEAGVGLRTSIVRPDIRPIAPNGRTGVLWDRCGVVVCPPEALASRLCVREPFFARRRAGIVVCGRLELRRGAYPSRYDLPLSRARCLEWVASERNGRRSSRARQEHEGEHAHRFLSVKSTGLRAK